MIRDLHDNYVTESPLVHEENGELSLHFGFPTIQSRMLKADPARLVLDYTRTMMGFLLFQPKPERIAMIGLGGGSLAKYCRLKLPDSDFTAIEISPAVIALRNEFGHTTGRHPFPDCLRRWRRIHARRNRIIRCHPGRWI